MTNRSNPHAPKSNRLESLRRASWKWSRRLFVLIVTPPLLYLIASAYGLIPANRYFHETADGVEIFVVTNGFHTDIVVPAVTNHCDWTALFPADHFGSQATLSHVQFGWGDRQFYIETPSWEDVRFDSVLRSSFLPTSCVMHVSYTGRFQASSDCVKISLSRRQHGRLVESIRNSFRLNSQGEALRIMDTGYDEHDAFYEAKGAYHIFNTCNCWTGRTLKSAGIRIGIWTPFPQSVMNTLPDTMNASNDERVQ